MTCADSAAADDLWRFFGAEMKVIIIFWRIPNAPSIRCSNTPNRVMVSDNCTIIRNIIILRTIAKNHAPFGVLQLGFFHSYSPSSSACPPLSDVIVPSSSIAKLKITSSCLPLLVSQALIFCSPGIKRFACGVFEKNSIASSHARRIRYFYFRI